MELVANTTREVLKEGIPSMLHVLKKGEHKEKKRLEDYPIVRCAPGEVILNVQRQHVIAFVLPLISHILITIFSLLIIFISFLNTQSMNLSFSINVVYIYILLSIICFFILIATYNYLYWYYMFYIITNKAIVHRHSFRIGGEYSETVYGEKMHVQDVDRVAMNLLYDILKIQDVYVTFHSQERQEPFIFKTPANAQKIDDIIQKLIVESRSTVII